MEYLGEKGMREHLRDLCAKEGGAKPWADKQRPKISHSYVSAVIRGDKMPGKTLLKAMKLKMVYRKKPPPVVMKFEDI